MGADDYHVSAEFSEEVKKRRRLDKYKQIETAAYRWFVGEITDKRMAEIVFGLINEEVQK